MTPYANLTAAQKEQVAYLFCDSFFGTDATCFEYELEGDQVARRRALTASKPGLQKIIKSVNVTSMQEPHASDDQIASASLVFDFLAQQVAEQIFNTQPMEIIHG